MQLRQKIWRQFFQLYRTPDLKDEVINDIHGYATSPYYVSVSEIIAHDATELLPFIAAELNPNSYHHCTIVQDYLDLLEGNNVPFDQAIRDRFKNDAYVLSEVLFDDWTEKRNLNLSHEEYEQLKKDRIRKHCSDYTFSDYARFFNLCVELQSNAPSSRNEYHLRNGIEQVLVNLAECDSRLYVMVVEQYFALGEPFKLNPYSLVKKLIEIAGSEKAYEILNQPVYPSKRRWLFSFFVTLPHSNVTPTRLEQLYALYQDADAIDFPYDMDFLLKFQSLDNIVVTKVTRILLKRADQDPNHARPLSAMFYPHAETNKRLIELFVDEIALLKLVYFKVCEPDSPEDYDGLTFARILKHDPNFIIEYIDWMYSRKEYPSRLDDTRDYLFLWRCDDYKELIKRTVEHISLLSGSG